MNNYLNIELEEYIVNKNISTDDTSNISTLEMWLDLLDKQWGELI